MRLFLARLVARLSLAVGVTLATVALAALAYDVRINWTSSVPVGLYRVAPITHLERDLLVTACLPEPIAARGRDRGYLRPGRCPGGVTPLLKPIAALAGDTVTVTLRGVSINGTLVDHSEPRTVDHAGLPVEVPLATYRLAPDEVFLLSTHDPASWDSRYWGPLTTDRLLSATTPWMVLR